MRIEKLQLLAYGHFRGLELDLSAPGLHLVFGPNEAGKSTTLRAITGLLYGIDVRTQDAHVHKPGDLRIGGVLAGEDGERIRIVRRKGNTNTLLDDQGQLVDEAVLRKLLRGVTEETFRTAFGLDHPMLQKGAEALLAGQGDLGESLFDASIGGGGEVQRMLRELADEADAIYKPRGTQLPLNEALRAFAEAQKTVKDTQSLPEAYVKQEEGLEQAKADRTRLRARRIELSTRRAQIDRARGTVPLERRRDKAVAERAPLVEIERHAPRIKSLAARLVAYERAVSERRERTNEAARLRDRVVEAARRAGVEPADAPRLDVRKENRILRLVNERTSLAERVASTAAEIARAQRELAKLRESTMGAPEDATQLARAAERARQMGDAEARLATDTARAERRRKQLEAKAASLGLFEGTLDALASLRLPAPAAIDALASRAAETDRVLARIEERLAAYALEAGALERQIAEQTGDFAPPDAAALEAARKTRDAAFTELQGADAKARATREAAFVRAMRDADELADRMIREADRVTMLARLRASQATLERQREEAAADRARAKKDRDALDAEHRALFAQSKLVPRGFAEMRAWLEGQSQIAQELERVREAEADVADAAKAIASAKQELRDALVVSRPDAGLSELLDDATRRVSVVETSRRVAEQATREATKLEVLVEEKTAVAAKDEAALAETRAALAELVTPLGVPDDASADEVLRAIEAQRELFAAVDERASVEARAAAAELEVRGFEEDVARVANELAADLVGVPAAEAASSLASRCADAQRLTQEIAAIDERLAELGSEPVSDELALLAADPEAILRAREEVDAELAEIEREISRVDQSIGSIESGLDRFRVDSGASDASARAQEALARVRANVEKYARAKLASVLLSREIERYREEHQAPMLAQASHLFSRLTLGRFSGVRAGFDDKDRVSLRCVRTGNVEVDVGGLSEGTRDQLYLSLRLASLLRHAEIGGAMPLVLDDVLIQYDDERSRAALSVLSEVAQKMQVLFFTHHARLVDLAESALAPSDLVVHQLAASSAAVAMAPPP